MKKFSSILLLICFSFSLVGYYVVHFIRVQEAKAEMNAFLKKSVQNKGVLELSIAGKSTLLKVLAGHLKPSSRKVILNGKELSIFQKKSGVVATIQQCFSPYGE